MEEVPNTKDSLKIEDLDSTAESDTSKAEEKYLIPPIEDVEKEEIDTTKELEKEPRKDEHYEPISENSFEMDDNAHVASARKKPSNNATSKKSNKTDKDDQSKETDTLEEKLAAVLGEEMLEEIASEEFVDEIQVGHESADFEEVDANIMGNAHAAATEESDMLGESDMTLPQQNDEESGIMEVDEVEEDVEVHEDDTPADIEMNSLEEDKEVNKSNEEEEDDVDESTNKLDTDEVDEVLKSKNADISEEAEEITEEVGETNKAKNVGLRKEGGNGNDEDAAEDEEAEHEDEPVENVQEPEESDVCLIPDDTENQMTEAEKEQAILARENAEKEDEEAEKEKDSASPKTVEDEEVDKAAKTFESSERCPLSGKSGIVSASQGNSAKFYKEHKFHGLRTSKTKKQNNNVKKVQKFNEKTNKQIGQNGQGKSGKLGQMVRESRGKSATNVEPKSKLAEAKGAAVGNGRKATDTAETADPDEPLLEELHNNTNETGVVSMKVIISWIVSTKGKCKQCEQDKLCRFRFKLPDASDFEYLCTQKCCDTFLSATPGKYFIRRKKFLVDELTNEEDAGGTTRQRCLQCKGMKKSKYFFKQDDDSYFVCSDNCFNALSEEEPEKYKLKRHSIRVRNIGAAASMVSDPPPAAVPKVVEKNEKIEKKTNESRVIARTASEAEAARLERAASFTRRCAECSTEVVLGDKNLLWETMDFCNEICLGKYQRTIGASCQTCNGEVPHQALGKYCVRFGFDIKQFCCAQCLNEYKKGLKTCSCCQKDISSGQEGFLAPVGDKEQFKDFCSQVCMRRYDSMCNPKKKTRNDVCSVCNNDKAVRVEIVIDEKEHNFCSNPCFSAFKFVSNIVADPCNMCNKFFERKGSESYTIYTERRTKVFCSRICMNVYIIVNRRIVSCQWCKVKKYNFDMIYKHQDSQEILMCSLNCLTLYGVSINAFSRAVAKCDNCSNSATPQYHLTMSDASMRNFCTYQCVMQFQSQFARAPLTLENENTPAQTQSSTSSAGGGNSKNSGNTTAPFPTGLPKRVKLRNATAPQPTVPKLQVKLPTKSNSGSKKGTPALPVISTVSSLASGETETRIGNVTVRRSRGRARKVDSPTPSIPTPAPPPPPQPTAPPLPTIANSVSTNTAVGVRGRLRKTVDYSQRSPSPIEHRSPTPPPPPTPRAAPAPTPRAAAATSPRAATVNNKRLPVVVDKSPTQSKDTKVQTETKIVTVPPYPPAQRNVQTSCKPQQVTVGFQTAPTTVSIGVQTDKDYSNKVLIPVPVPIYVPQPMYMYSAPFPVPVPIPLPIPVPIFIPTTRNSAQGILKEIKKIQDKMPADPFEAELLMMAEMVAEEKRESESDSDDEVKPEPTEVTLQYENNLQPVEVGNNYSEDVLQMAIKMVSGDYDQPTVDLESAMTTNTITNPPPEMVTHDDSMSHMSAHHMAHQQQQQHHIVDAHRGGRGRKRGSIATPVSARNNRSPIKRPRLQEMEVVPQPPQPVLPMEKPDANMCLKYTFGVNAWKQWVMTKNADIEKSTVRRRQFKTELLQMTADELNYSLCLFVKEVRKPNGTEYAPDTIYYLVLGIQQYLYENGRIDNIFTDPYYEPFTDCLDEVARKFSVLYNDSQYIVTRVEEEHLWECKQLGAHSPHVLLSTLMFFNTKHFNLTTVEEHMQLSFSHIMKHWKRSAQNAKSPGTRNVLLRFYPPQSGLDANPRKKKVYEQQENEENPLRCPVRLYEFYLSKCPESVKTRNDVFYLQPERSCVPDSPVWYSTQALSHESLQKMLHRVKMVKEINIALLTS